MGEDYTKRELDTFFSDIKEALKGHDKAHEKILDQVIKTNGRVKSLELWRAFLAGGLAILAIIVVPLVFIIIQKFL